MQIVWGLAPLIVIIGGAVVALFIGLLRSAAAQRIAQAVTLAAILAAVILFLRSFGQHAVALGGVLVFDPLTLVLAITASASAFMFALISLPYISARRKIPGTEFYFFLLTALAGTVIMTASGNLLVIVIGLEILSVSLYFLTAMDSTDVRGIEGAVKYFIMGAVALAFTLYGISLIYGFTHSIELEKAVAFAAANGPYPIYFYVGVLFVVIGFAFKLALVPFHFWAPDAYEGASVLATGIMSVLPKIAGFAVLAKISGFFFAVQSTAPGREKMLFIGAIAVLAVLSMIVGNVLALAQPSLKRLLAYSAIVHSGFIASVLITEGGIQQAAVYLAAYAATTVGLFSVLTAIASDRDGSLTLPGLNGLSARSPLLAMLGVVFVASLAGIPPLAGFIGKFFVFKGLIEGGYTPLAVIGIVNAFLAAVYYLRIVMAMYAYNDVPSAQATVMPKPPVSAIAVAVAAAVIVIGIGVWPNVILGQF